MTEVSCFKIWSTLKSPDTCYIIFGLNPLQKSTCWLLVELKASHYTETQKLSESKKNSGVPPFTCAPGWQSFTWRLVRWQKVGDGENFGSESWIQRQQGVRILKGGWQARKSGWMFSSILLFSVFKHNTESAAQTGKRGDRNAVMCVMYVCIRGVQEESKRDGETLLQAW